MQKFPPVSIRQLTEQQAAELTGYSRYWFQRKRWEGGGPPYRKMAHAVRYPEDELMRWIESHPLRTSTSGLDLKKAMG